MNRDDDDEFGGPPVPQFAIQSIKMTTEMYKNYTNICKTDVDSEIKGIMLAKMNEAYVAATKKKQEAIQAAWN